VNEQTDDLDQTDEEILTYTLSDEALEAAAGTETGEPTRQITNIHCAVMFC
jgi:hypothetical protein